MQRRYTSAPCMCMSIHSGVIFVDSLHCEKREISPPRKIPAVRYVFVSPSANSVRVEMTFSGDFSELTAEEGAEEELER